jgi:RNA polymerase sigma factor (sigma-70 family)
MTEMTKYLTAGEEQILLDAACGGDIDARNSVIMNIYSLVRHHVGKCFALTDNEREDAVQFVVTVLCEKFHKFNSTRRVRYMTYANHWVRYALQQFRIKRRLIPAPKKPVFVTSIEPSEHDDDHYFPDCLCAPDSSPTLALERADELAELNRVVNRLRDKEREIVLRRSRGEKLQPIADSLGITRERVRQIEISALQRMREWFRT